MSATGERMVDHNVIAEGLSAGVGAVVGGVAGWLWAAMRKLSKADLDVKLAERDKMLIDPMRLDIHEMQRDQKSFVTREQLKQIMDDYRQVSDQQHALLRADMSQIRAILERRN
jgi:hypothetical protein